MKDDKVYLLHIRDAIQSIFDYTAAGKENFLKTKLIQDGVIRNLEIIGEAVKNVSDALKSKYKDMRWKQIAGMRDKMIHQYFGVNLEIVWEVVAKDLPPLQKKIEEILKTS